MDDLKLIRKWKLTGLLEIPQSVELELAKGFELLHLSYLRSRQGDEPEHFRYSNLILPIYTRLYWEGKKVKNLRTFISALDNSNIIDDKDDEAINEFIESYKN